MNEQFSRTALQFGCDRMQKLFAARVAVFGLGGVGGHCAEALARSGVGAIDLFDHDRICPSNLNRQLIATHQTVGEYKADVMRRRILDIHPAARVGAHRVFYGPETAKDWDLSVYGYIVDAVDTVTAKLELICRAGAVGVPVISCMGAANKLDPTAFRVADIYATSGCPLARVMRRALRARNIPALKVVYSPEPATPLLETVPDDTGRRRIPASNAFVPPVAGLILAGEVVKALAGIR